jgi:hypothetical protein
MKKITLTPKDFEKLFGEKLSEYVKNKIDSYALAYFPATEKEKEEVFIKIVDTLVDPFLVYSGPHRLRQWENGWGENFNDFNSSGKAEAVNPRYFGKYPINRLNQKFIRAASENFERNMLYVILDYLFDTRLRKSENVYEFGCGTGHNLLRVREVNPSANLIGLDWAKSSQKIIKKMAESETEKNIKGYNFDFFKPNEKIKIAPNSAVYTVAALEQVGSNHKKFVSYLIKNKPDICIHVEPIAELLDETRLIDNLSIKYFKKRHYLNGFLTHLRQLEQAGKIKIHEAKRSYIGSFFIEGYSIIIWSPIKK